MSKKLIGTVETINEKTVKVLVWRVYRHKKYHKELKVKKHYLVHNEDQDIVVGDSVVIDQSKPISKRKRHIIKKVVKK